MGGARFLRRGEAEPAPGEALSWVEGIELLSGDAIAIPEDIVRLADVPGCRYWQTSDGLGTGSNLHEAAIHGICELIERDAMALWSLRGDSAVAGHELARSALGSREIDAVERKIVAAGLRLRLFDITSNVRVPSFLAIIVPDVAPAGLAYFDVASGSGTHPVAARAALRAITEAAQTPLTTITGSRDDVDPDDYRRSLPHDLAVYGKAAAVPAGRPPPEGYAAARSLPAISSGWSRA
ncbi:MAG: YcaO-like family protein [Bauldia sp.]